MNVAKQDWHYEDEAVPPDELYVPRPAEIVAIEDLTDEERLFTLQLKDGKRLPPGGQFLQVSLFGYEEAPFSLCSAPLEGSRTFELCIRRVGKITNALHKLTLHDEIGIRGPFGRPFPVDQMHGKDVVMIANGLGLAPMRYLIQQLLYDREKFGKMTLFYGCRGLSTVLFREEIPQWRALKDFDITLATYDWEPGWDGYVGSLVDPVEQLQVNGPNTVACLTCSPKRYRTYIGLMDAKGVEPENMYLCLERHMRCGVGKCGHCMVKGIYCCQDGPVFSYGELMHVKGSLV